MGVIEVKNLVKQYKSAKTPSVDGVSFTVNKGEFFAFLGPNGAGKTTTISILTTTLSKTSGGVNIAGFDVEKEARQVREKIGIIFQKPSLDAQLTAEQNIRFHAALYGMCTYQPSFKLMPAAYRKLEIIRSLMHTPEVLFLDEPTQGLDAVRFSDDEHFMG